MSRQWPALVAAMEVMEEADLEVATAAATAAATAVATAEDSAAATAEDWVEAVHLVENAKCSGTSGVLCWC